MISRAKAGIASIGFLATVTLTGVTPAFGATGVSSGTSTTSESSMSITGYDRAVASAHGYRIVEDDSGHESSEPVTVEAKAEVDATRKEGRTTVTGSCGKASLTTKPIASQGRIAISTSYSLSGGRRSFGHLWKVDGTSRLGQPFTESFSGANNLDSTWSATHSISLYGFSHGTNSLHLTNHAKLTNGGICTAKIVLNSW